MKLAPIHIINLRQSADRRRHIAQQFSKTKIRPMFFPAFDGHSKAFPFFVFQALSGRWWHDAENFKPGAFACFLSHAAIWAKVARGQSPYAFVFEDDVAFDFDGLETARLDIGNAPKPFDIVFVNQRMHNYVSNLEGEDAIINVSHLLYERVLDGTYANRVPVPGGDGYAVSKRGARKLLHMCNSRGINMGVDSLLSH